MDPIDIGIITIREDEFRALLNQFTEGEERVSGRREYNVRTLRTTKGNNYRIGIIRCLGQGNLEAKGAAEDLIRDLRPSWLLVVGIAGAAPSTEFSLGDVAVSSYVYDFSVEAALTDGGREFSVSGGSLHPLAAPMVADLPSRELEMVGWNGPDRVGSPRPVQKYRAAECKGDVAWKGKVKSCFEAAFGTLRSPRVTARRIAASDRLVKDPDLLRLWQTVARHAEVIEMESAGAYHAAHANQVPFLAIRGISDVVGYARADEWTRYACRAAAAFTRGYLETEPFQLGLAQGRTASERSETRRSTRESQVQINDDTKRLYQALQTEHLGSWRLFDFGRDIHLDHVFVQEVFEEARSGPIPIPTPVRDPIPDGQLLEEVLSRKPKKESRCWVIQGEPGSGKSTVLRSWTLRVYQKLAQSRSSRLPIPLFLSLRYLSEFLRRYGDPAVTPNALAYCFSQTIPGLSGAHASAPFHSIDALREREHVTLRVLLDWRKCPPAEWLLLLDGLDEMSADYREPLFQWIKGLPKRVRVVLATPPVSG